MFRWYRHCLLAVLTVCAATRKPTWTSYSDKILSVCTPKWTSLTLLDVAIHRLRCVLHQRLYLQCIPLAKMYLFHLMKSSRYTKPCGFIRSHQHRSSRFVYWDISVTHSFYLYLTFYRFSLPMAHGSCQQRQSSEYVYIKDNSQFHQTPSTEVHLCGKRSPFSLLLNSNSVWLIYSKEMGFKIRNVGSFLINYQVYDAARASSNVVINHYRVIDNMGALHLTQLYLYQLKKGSKEVSVHILGDRFQVLLATINGREMLLDDLNIVAYDGPGPSEKHQVFPRKQNESDGLQIQFATFQAYIQIVCYEWHCFKVQIKYLFRFALSFVKKAFTYTKKTFQQQQIAEIRFPHPEVCSTNTLLYCLFEINLGANIGETGIVDGSHIYDKVQITFENIFFSGPDYVGSYPERHKCLLAGISVVDAYRLELMQGNSMNGSDANMKDVIDNILPEVTMCYTIPQEKSGEPGKLTHGLPMKVFTSTSQIVYVLLYAYGGYIDLNKYLVTLTASVTDCLGVLVGCPISTADSLLTLSRDIIQFNPNSKIPGKKDFCPDGHMALTEILDQYLEKFIYLRIYYCTATIKGKYYITTFIQQTTEDGEDSERCLFVQANPTVVYSDRSCEARVQGFNKYLVDVSLFQSLKCTVAAVAESLYLVHGDGQEIILNTSPSRRVFAGALLSVVYNSNCLHYSVNVTSQCLVAEKSTLIGANGGDTGLFHDDSRPICDQYVIPGDTRQMYKIEIRKNVMIKTLQLDAVLVKEGYFSHFQSSSYLVSGFLGFYALDVKLSLFGDCARNCSYYEISAVYEESSERSLVLLQWRVHLQSSREFEIFLSQIPVKGWLIYVQNLCFANSNGQAKCSVVARIDDTRIIGTKILHDTLTQNITSFVTYHFLWTKEEYTWLDAESLCAGLGMHLVSITSHSEHVIVTDLLSGAGYGSHRGALLTPCRTESPLCIIFIGLQVKVRCQVYESFQIQRHSKR